MSWSCGSRAWSRRLTTLAPCKRLARRVPLVLCVAWLIGPSPAAAQTRPSDDLPEPIIPVSYTHLTLPTIYSV